MFSFIPRSDSVCILFPVQHPVLSLGLRLACTEKLHGAVLVVSHQSYIGPATPDKSWAGTWHQG